MYPNSGSPAPAAGSYPGSGQRPGCRLPAGVCAPTIWRTELARILNHISDTADHRTRIYVLGIQPIRAIPVFNTAIFETLADRHATTLNRHSEGLCASTPHTTFVPLTGRFFTVSARYRTSSDCQKWVESLATEMAAGLTATSLSRR